MSNDYLGKRSNKNNNILGDYRHHKTGVVSEAGVK